MASDLTACCCNHNWDTRRTRNRARGFTKTLPARHGRETPPLASPCRHYRLTPRWSSGWLTRATSLLRRSRRSYTFGAAAAAFVRDRVARRRAVGGVAGNMLSTAFGQGFGMHRIGWHGARRLGRTMLTGAIERHRRITSTVAVELGATADQQAKIAGIAKAAVADLARAAGEGAGRAATPGGRALDRAHRRSVRSSGCARADRSLRNGEQAHRAGAGRRHRGAEPRAAPKVARTLDDLLGGPWARWHRG